MSTADFKLTAAGVPGMYGTPTLIFWISIFAVLPVAAVFGGMQFILLAIAAGVSVIVWKHPQEAPGAGMLFLFAAGILLPYGARMDLYGPIWQMYYWAVGVLVITMSAILKLGIGRIVCIPLSAKAFLGVALVAACYGIAHGESASYVLRQLYGAALLIAYFAIAFSAGDQELLLKRIRVFGVLCAVCFFIYYAAVFAEYGFHKEMGFNGTQASFLASVLFVAGLERGRRSWIVAAFAILFVPFLIFMRKDVLSFLAVVAIALAVKLKSRVGRVLCYSTIGFITLIALFPPVTDVIAEELLRTPVIGNLLPPGVQDASTLVGRTAQLEATLETLRAQPWLGVGLGGELEVVDPFTRVLHIQLYEDNGWGYLLQKMGLVGAAAFLWFLVTVIGGFSRRSIALSSCIVAAILISMFSEPVFFHFTTAPFLGTYAGLLLARRERQRRLEETPRLSPALAQGEGFTR